MVNTSDISPTEMALCTIINGYDRQNMTKK